MICLHVFLNGAPKGCQGQSVRSIGNFPLGISIRESLLWYHALRLRLDTSEASIHK